MGQKKHSHKSKTHPKTHPKDPPLRKWLPLKWMVYIQKIASNKQNRPVNEMASTKRNCFQQKEMLPLKKNHFL